MLENYLVTLPKCLSTPLCKFRCNNFRLAVVRGRYSNIPRERRYCDICNEDKIGDEYHIMFECQHPLIYNLRLKYISRFYINNISMFKFVQLFTDMEKNT